MANVRGRMLHGSISNSQRVNGLSCDGARLLFTWLIPHTDNLGRMRADPIQLKASVFPRHRATLAEIDRWTLELGEAGLVLLYDCQGQRFLQIERNDRYQRLTGNMSKHSELPDPNDSVCTPYIRRENGVPLEGEVEGEGEKEGEGESASTNGVHTARQLRREWEGTFEEYFWPAYPRKVNRAEALKAWMRVGADASELKSLEKLAGEIMDGLNWYKATEWRECPMDKVTHASTWLNQRRYADVRETN